jgi:hypothetical protein
VEQLILWQIQTSQRVLFFFFWDKVLPCCLVRPWTPELKPFSCLSLSSAGITDMSHHTWHMWIIDSHAVEEVYCKTNIDIRNCHYIGIPPITVTSTFPCYTPSEPLTTSSLFISTILSDQEFYISGIICNLGFFS